MNTQRICNDHYFSEINFKALGEIQIGKTAVRIHRQKKTWGGFLTKSLGGGLHFLEKSHNGVHFLFFYGIKKKFPQRGAITSRPLCVHVSRHREKLITLAKLLQ